MREDVNGSNKACAVLVRSAVLVVCLFFLGGWRSPFDTPAARNRKANEFYRQEKYDEALKKYSDAQLDFPDSAKLHYNLGAALFRKKDYKGAASEFQAAATGHDHSIKSDALYNLGNAQFNLQKYQEAVKAYESVLKLDQEDKQARHNLEVAEKMLEKQEQESHDHQDQKEDKKEDKKEDQQKKDKEDQSSAEDEEESKRPEQKDQPEKKPDEQKKKDHDKALENEQKDKDKTKDQQEAESAERKPLDKDQMSQEEAQRILDALKNDELKFQQERFQQSREVEVEKDW